MKINLLNADAIEVLGLEDLAFMVPPGRSGEPLNYGQGEGQFRVDETVWGFYCAPHRYLQLEEGSLAPPDMLIMLQDIVGAIRERWGAGVDAKVSGMLGESVVP